MFAGDFRVVSAPEHRVFDANARHLVGARFDLVAARLRGDVIGGIGDPCLKVESGGFERPEKDEPVAALGERLDDFARMGSAARNHNEAFGAEIAFRARDEPRYFIGARRGTCNMVGHGNARAVEQHSNAHRQSFVAIDSVRQSSVCRVHIACVGQGKRSENQQHRIDLVRLANCLVGFREMRHEGSLVAREALESGVRVGQREIACARERGAALPRLALGGHVNHAFGCEHLENAARMRGKADMSRAIFEETPNA